MSINQGLYSSEKSDWETPQGLFDELNEEFNFALDVCATNDNAKCVNYLSIAEDALECPWSEISRQQACWMNPPYGRGIGKFVQKAWDESLNCQVVCLLPARIDTQWWSIFWDRENHKSKDGCQVRFLQGRLKFGNAKNSAPFPSAIVIMDRRGVRDENP